MVGGGWLNIVQCAVTSYDVIKTWNLYIVRVSGLVAASANGNSNVRIRSRDSLDPW